MRGRPGGGSARWSGAVRRSPLLGLAALLVTASGPAPARVLSLTEALVVAGTTAAAIGLLSRPGARPGAAARDRVRLRLRCGLALTQTVTVAATDRSGPVLSVEVVVGAVLVAAFAVGGLLLSQTAYRGGLGAPLAVVTLANPVAAAVIGLTLLGQGLRGGAAGVLLALAGAGLAAWGVVLLTRAAPGPGHRAEGYGGPDASEEHPVAAGAGPGAGGDGRAGAAPPPAGAAGASHGSVSTYGGGRCAEVIHGHRPPTPYCPAFRRRRSAPAAGVLR